MLVTVNSKDYVRWLFKLPLMKLMKRINSARAFAVARHLAAAAGRSPDAEIILRLAHQVWMLPMHLGGDLATVVECQEFLNDYRPYLPGADVDAVVALIESGMLGPVEPGFSLQKTTVEYRAERPVLGAPMIAKRGRGRRKKWPADDLTEKICKAFDAMQGAKCSRPAAFVAEGLKDSGLVQAEYCTVPHVLSRARVFSDRLPEVNQQLPGYLFNYWQNLDPANQSKSVADPEWPTGFAFSRCDC